LFGLNVKVVTIGPQFGSKSLEYKYQSLSIVALKIRSISSPTLAFPAEAEVDHLAGFRICGWQIPAAMKDRTKRKDFSRIGWKCSNNEARRNLVDGWQIQMPLFSADHADFR